MKRSRSSQEDRGKRLGPQARGSMEFLLLCMKRGVPPDKIAGFLLGLGIDAHTVNRWMDMLKREMAGIPERTVSGNYAAPEPVARPAGSEPLTLDGKTNTGFVLPDLDATKTVAKQIEDQQMDFEEIEVSLEISDKELQKQAQENKTDGRMVLDAPPSLLVSPTPDSIPGIPESPRVQLEKQRPSKKCSKSRRDERKFLATPQARLAAFAAVILITWLLSDSGWFPGGSTRQSTLPSHDMVAKEEPVLRPAPVVEPPVAVAPVEPQPAPVQSPPPPQEEAKVQDYPDPWSKPAVKRDSNRSPGSGKNKGQRRTKRQRPSY